MYVFIDTLIKYTFWLIGKCDCLKLKYIVYKLTHLLIIQPPSCVSSSSTYARQFSPGSALSPSVVHSGRSSSSASPAPSPSPAALSWISSVTGHGPLYLPICLQSVCGPFLSPFIPVHSGSAGVPPVNFL